MSFANPWILGILPVYLTLFLYYYYKVRTESLNLPTAGFTRPRRTWRTEVVRWIRILPLPAGLLLLMALANPQRVEIRKHVQPSGIEIMIALDVSGSMAAEDFQPLNRLAVAKDVLRDFIRGRSADRIGLIAFAGMSVTRSPLTLQQDSLLKAVESTRMGDLPEGTAIGYAILCGINRLSAGNVPEKRGTRILVLITDGRNNAGEVHPIDALPIAARQGIKIYTIGVGSFGPVPFPVLNVPGRKQYIYEKADLDENLLRQIAERSGGKYFRAADPRSLQLLFSQINTLEKSEPRVTESRSIHSYARPWALSAFAILCCYTVLTITIVRLP